MLCHTGLVWESTVDGRVLHFHLAGINNKNCVKAIHGPVQAHQLTSVFHDEVSFAIWKREQPQGRVLKPDERIATANLYEKANWEEQVGRMRVGEGTDVDKRLAPRTLLRG